MIYAGSKEEIFRVMSEGRGFDNISSIVLIICWRYRYCKGIPVKKVKVESTILLCEV